jgi:Mg2+ and Co2+ transporter CorA
MSVQALLSKADGTDETVDLGEWEARPLSADELLWIDVDAADDIDSVVRALRLDNDLAARLTADAGRPVAHVRDEGVEVVFLSLAEDLDDDPRPVRILAGEGWVVTQHARPVPFLDTHRELIQDQREVGRLTSIEFVASVLDWHVDTFVSAAAELERAVDRLDDAALRTERDLVNRLVEVRRRVARVRRVLVPHLDVSAELTRRDFLPASMADHSEAFVPVAKRLERAGDAIADVREMLIGTFDIHMTRVAQRTNDTMRILTLASVIFLPSVVLAGVMGMNFEAPLFDQPDLFWVVIAAMFAMAGVTLVLARWRGWL